MSEIQVLRQSLKSLKTVEAIAFAVGACQSIPELVGCDHGGVVLLNHR